MAFSAGADHKLMSELFVAVSSLCDILWIGIGILKTGHTVPCPPRRNISKLSKRCRVCLLGLGIGLAAPAFGNTIVVSTDGGLRAALSPASGAQSGDTVSFSGNITLSGDLPAVQNSITIEGNGYTLDGNSQFRGFLVAAFAPGTATPIGVNATIRDLTIQHAVAKGGNSGYGGGGAGFGGSIFVANLANVTLSNIILSSNSAIGGSAGRDYNNQGTFISGGGGMGGDGYSGGGGVGVGSIGANVGNNSGLTTRMALR